MKTKMQEISPFPAGYLFEYLPVANSLGGGR